MFFIVTVNLVIGIVILFWLYVQCFWQKMVWMYLNRNKELPLGIQIREIFENMKSFFHYEGVAYVQKLKKGYRTLFSFGFSEELEGKLDEILDGKKNTLKLHRRIYISRNVLFSPRETEAVYIYTHPLTYYYSRLVRLLSGSYSSRFLSSIQSQLEENRDLPVFQKLTEYALIYLDEKLNIQGWNNGAEEIFGIGFEEVMEKPLVDYIERSSRKLFTAQMNNLMDEDEKKFHIKVPGKNHTTVITEFVARSYDYLNQRQGYILVVKDVTSEEIWKENIRMQSRINKSIVENTQDGMVLLNKENRIIFANEKARQIAEYPFPVIGLDICQVYSGPVWRDWIAQLTSIQNQEADHQTITVKKDESWFHLRSFAIQNRGEYDGILLFLIDETDIMSARERLEAISREMIANLETAKRLHWGLMPETLPSDETKTFESIFLPSDSIGGDFYSVDRLEMGDESAYSLIVADVAGHGIAASMLTVLIKEAYEEYLLQTETRKQPVIGEFLNALNSKILSFNFEDSRFVSLYVCLVYPKSHKVYYSSAGHPHAMIWSKSQGLTTAGMKNSPPVGILDQFRYSNYDRDMEAGEKWFLYTDGILDIFESEQDKMKEFTRSVADKTVLEIRMLFEKQIEENMTRELELNPYMIFDDVTMILAEFRE